MSGEQPAATGLAGRYATALFELAQEQGKLDAVGSDLAQFEAMLNESEDFARLVRSPIVSRDDQVKAISALADKAGMDDLTKRFAGYIASQRRLFALADIIRAFNGLLAAHRGEVVAEVSSAKKLTQKQTAALEAALKKAIGSDVQVQATVDSSLIGGLIVKVGSRMIDGSLRTKLQGLKLAMKGVG